jgi:hypothetical protein
VIQNCISLVILFVLNGLLLNEYKKYYRKKNRIVSRAVPQVKTQVTTNHSINHMSPRTNNALTLTNSNGSKETKKKADLQNREPSYNFMIFACSSSFMISRCAECVGTLIMVTDQLNNIRFNPTTETILMLAHFLTYISFSSSIIFYIKWNKIFRAKLIDIFKLKFCV